MKIAIRYADNDFINTFTPVMNCILESYRHTGEIITDKEKLCTIINEISYGMYLLFQNRFTYIDNNNTKLYLQLTSDRIMFNEEVDEYCAKLIDNWDNAETVILDTDLDHPGSNPIYVI